MCGVVDAGCSQLAAETADNKACSRLSLEPPVGWSGYCGVLLVSRGLGIGISLSWRYPFPANVSAWVVIRRLLVYRLRQLPLVSGCLGWLRLVYSTCENAYGHTSGQMGYTAMRSGTPVSEIARMLGGIQ